MIRFYVVFAIFSRNFKQYFTSVLGYLFIFVFVTLCAILTFSPQFFVDNLANLDQLNKYFPVLLLIFIPAITMSVWADEKKQGTDAILFTLPASDLEILAGKYFAVVAVYSVALLFSGTELIALETLGSPDWGVIATTYIGYWLAGVAMLAMGMFASSLTSSTTVAFVIGAILCAIPVMIGYVFAGYQTLDSYGVGPQLRDFSLGLISLPGIVYFLSITFFMLYLNLVVISKRHWSRGQSVTLAGHFSTRVAALAIGLVALNLLADRSSAIFQNRIDLTSEQLYSLDETTRNTIAAAAKNDRPVMIQAFISPEVPTKYVSTRKQLIGLLRQYERLGTGNIDVRIVDVNPNSDQVDEARSLGINPQPSRDIVAGKVVEQDVYLGTVVTSTLDEITLPFIDGDTSIEYELTRSIATTTNKAKKLRVGILRTDAHFNNLEVEGRVYDWTSPTAIEELSRQYDLIDIDPGELPTLMAVETKEKEIKEQGPSTRAATQRPDVMIVVDPSSLTTSGMTHLVAWIGAGNPTLILADPLPFHWFTFQAPRELGVVNAPASPRISPQAAWGPVATTPEPKAENGTAGPLLDLLGISWKHDRVVWSLNNPHLSFKPVFPERLGGRWPENYGPRDSALLFALDGGTFEVFNPENPISSGLQEVLFSYPGSLAPVNDAKTKFEPLVMLKPGTAGHYDWNEITEDLVSTRQEVNRFTGEVEQITGPVPSRYTGNNVRVLRNSPKLVRSRLEIADDVVVGSEAVNSGNTAETNASDNSGSESRGRSKIDDFQHVLAARITGTTADADSGSADGNKPKLNVVFIADADFASDFVVEQQSALDAPLDNLTFLVNAIETLAGVEDFVRLRNRRAVSRTLTAIENATESCKIAAAIEQDQLDAEIEQKLADAQAAIEKTTQRIQNDQEMSVWQKIQEAGLSLASENRKFEKQTEKLAREREKKTDNIATEKQRKIDGVESRIRWISIISAGIPALLLGSIVLLFRTLREQKYLDPNRRVSN